MKMYNLIFGRRKTFEVNNAEYTYKVHYLGNVMTSHVRAPSSNLNIEQQFFQTNEDLSLNSTVAPSLDKPVKILWDNHVKNNGRAGIKMKLTLTQGGLKVDTKDHGVTEYFGHRIYLVKTHSLNPKLLVWVYQHVGKNLKTEIRCHAALCQNTKHARTIELLLNEKLRQTFREYKREKRRLQNSRLCNSKNGGCLQSQLGNRKRAFRNMTHNYKPPVQHGMCSAPKLDDVLEEDENEEANECEKQTEERMEIVEQSESDEEKQVDEENGEFLYYDDHEEDILFSEQNAKRSTSSCSSSSISSVSSPSPTTMYDEALNSCSKKKFTEVSYEFSSDLSKTSNQSRKSLNHSKSFKQSQQSFSNPFSRNNFSRSFTAFTSRFRANSNQTENAKNSDYIKEFKELTLSNNLENSSSSSSLSSPALSTCSNSSTASSASVKLVTLTQECI